MPAPIVTFLSDYGLEDPFVGVCHGVIARRCPEARVIDLSHGIPRHDVRAGAIALRDAIAFVPVGVHLAIVDPEVGAERRAIALETADGNRFVGPDNGLLWLAAERCGGPAEAADISRSAHRLEPVSATFHGRDIFAPVAAALAAGEALAESGEPIEVSEVATLELPRAEIRDGELVAHVVSLDRFGNAALDATHAQLLEAGVTLGREFEVEVAGLQAGGRMLTTFAEASAGTLLLYEDAQQMLALALNRGSAADHLALHPGAELRIRVR